MRYVLAIVLVLAMFLPAQRPSCVVRYTSGGSAVCWCKVARPGAQWKTAPGVACRLWR